MLKPCSWRSHYCCLLFALSAAACSSSLDAGLAAGGAVKPAVRPNGPAVQSDVNIFTDAPVGWASVNDLGQDGTTGGGAADPTMVGTIEQLIAAAQGTAPAVLQLTASMTGSVKVGSNKTIEGAPGAGVVFTGHLGYSRSANDILRNLTIVGFNCTDLTPGETCQEGAGADAVTIQTSSHHIWVDHCDISDGSDGNLDIVTQSDYVTVSWTKFHYASPPRAGGHLFSNLIGSSDSDTGDKGHLRITFHHDWWADNVVERMPRARFGQVHLFNNLYQPFGDPLYCVGVGVGVNILLENNDFIMIRDPIDSTHFPSDATSVAVSFGNLYDSSIVPKDVGIGPVFTPPYDYTVQPAADVRNTVTTNAGPR